VFQSLARKTTRVALKGVVAEMSQATVLPVYRARAGSATESELRGAEAGSEPTLIFRCNLILQTRDI
jgi:hypothetical protein